MTWSTCWLRAELRGTEHCRDRCTVPEVKAGMGELRSAVEREYAACIPGDAHHSSLVDIREILVTHVCVMVTGYLHSYIVRTPFE